MTENKLPVNKLLALAAFVVALVILILYIVKVVPFQPALIYEVSDLVLYTTAKDLI